jgi:primosomal protein N' (replication factor Y) (superfamily II helicase)
MLSVFYNTMKSKSQQPGLFGPLETKSSSRTISADSARLVRVAVENGADQVFDYAIPDEFTDKLSPGQRVRVPFGKGNRSAVAFCIEFPQETNVQQVKYITEILDVTPLLDPIRLDLARWIAQYYCAPLGAVLSAMVPAAVKKQIGIRKKTYVRLTENALNPPTDDQPSPRLSPKGRTILEYLKRRASNKIKVSHVCHSERSEESQFISGGKTLRFTQGDKKEVSLEALNTQSTQDLIPVEQITAELNCTKQPLNTLAHAGMIEFIQRLEFSQPISDNATVETQPQFELNDDQQRALAEAEKIIASQSFSVILLHGVTGSGKTEIYMRCIEKILQTGKQALVLVPEIALTPQTVNRFTARFGSVPVMHSALSGVQRHQQWRWIAQGHAQVVVGARSAIFAPLPKLGIIVVDEEHESSYKQDTTPRYHARDVAIKLAQNLSLPVILGSATPSLESTLNCKTKPFFHLLSLPRRVLDLPLPPVQVVDMRREMLERKGNSILSRSLEDQLGQCLRRNRQAILLLNRRGHSSFIFCPSCSYILGCPHCDVSLTCHKKQRQLDISERVWVMCHHCTHKSQLPTHCPVCAKKLRLIGPGTQKAEQEVKRKFPEAQVVRVDSDSMKPDMYNQVMDDFGTGKIDILLGTQMIGKGLDFPNVVLVGVLNADTALSIPDFRSSERTFQMIAQVAGRCGRASPDSNVVVQTYLPEEPAVQLACRHDYNEFAKRELAIRQAHQVPPFARLARIVLRDKKLEKVESTGQQLRKDIDFLIRERSLDMIKIRGPVPAALARLEEYFRQHILLQAQTAEPIQNLLSQLRNTFLKTIAVHAAVDVDPVNLM